MFKLIRLIAAFMFLATLLVSAQDELAEERLLLTFVPNVQFAPFYVGIEDGYFAEAGFDLRLEHLQEPEVLDLVAVGQANFGIVSGEQVILARAHGRDVVYVFEWFQQYPVGLVFSSDLDLTDLEDLRGMTVGIPGRFGASYSGLTTLLASAGLTEDDVELQEIGFYAPDVFCLGVVDAAIVYINNEPLQIRSRADAGECGDVQDVSVVSVASQTDLVSNGLIVNRAVLDEDPEAVGRMAQGLSKALSAAINNPAAAYLVSLDYVENLPADDMLVNALRAAAERQSEFLSGDPDREAIASSRLALAADLEAKLDTDSLTQFTVLLNTIELWDAERLGYSDLRSWEAMRDTLDLMGFLDDDAGDLTDAFTNQFVTDSSE